MQIFALETDVQKIIKRFASKDDPPLLTVFYDGILFFLALFKAAVFTLVLAIIAAAIYEFTPIPLSWVIGVTVVMWLLIVPIRVLRRYIDWRFDFIYLTEQKLVVVNQTFIFHQEVKQINLENVASVTAETQLLNLFGFGVVRISLKEGHGGEVMLKFVPNASLVSDRIADAVSRFERQND